MSHLKVNTSNEQFYELLKHHIDNDLPLSMTRFGDGEIAFLNRNVPKVLRERFNSNWGYNPSNYKVGENLVVSILEKSLKLSDIVGIMNLNNPICKKMGCGKEWTVKTEHVDRVGREKDLLTCDHQITRGPILGDVKKLKGILGGRSIHIVSPRSEQLKKKNLNKLLGCEINYTKVNYKSKLSDRAEIFNKVDKIEETIVIISLGILGKDIPQYLASKGKIALDFGATVDAWSGVISRGWFNKGGLQDYCTIK